MQLEYKDENGHPTTVAIRLHFVDSDNRMPYVFVISPRLEGSFIHFGAVCSLELMSQSWPITNESTFLLIEALHSTLQPFDGRLSFDLERPAYTTVDHENGVRHIRQAHSNLFRSPVSSKPAVTSSSLSQTSSDTSSAISVKTVTSQEEFDLALLDHGHQTRIHIPLGLSIDVSGKSVFTHLSLELLSVMEPGPLVEKPRIHFVDAHIKGVVNLKNISVSGKLTIRGSLRLDHVEFNGHMVVEERGSLAMEDSHIVLTAEPARTDCIAVLDESSFIAKRCTIEREEEGPVLKSLILLTNSCSAYFEMCPEIRSLASDRTIFAEQNSRLEMVRCSVTSGSGSCVSIQGCTGTFEHVSFCGIDKIELQVSDSNRPTGLNVELGGKAMGKHCVAKNLYFGFSVIAHSLLTLQDSFAANVVNGYTIDCSCATLLDCGAQTNHVGIFVLNRAKCDAKYTNELSFGERNADYSDLPDNCISGGMFAAELRNGHLSLSGATLHHASDTALYVYDEGVLEAKECIILGQASNPKQSCGVKVYKAQATICSVVTVDCAFGIAAIQSPSLIAQECLTLGGTNGFTLDNSTAELTNCACNCNHVGIFVLNRAVVTIDNSTAPNGTAIRGKSYGVEVRDADATCKSVTVARSSDSAFNCYNNGKLILHDCIVDLREEENSPKNSGIKVWSGSYCEATNCQAKNVMFGYAVIGSQTCLKATDCSTSMITNGFTVDGAKAELVNCVANSNHVGIFVLNGGICHVRSGQYSNGMFGIESRGGEVKVSGGTKITNFARTGLYSYDEALVDVDGLQIDAGGDISAQHAGIRLERTKSSISNILVRNTNVGLFLGSGSTCSLRESIFAEISHGINVDGSELQTSKTRCNARQIGLFAFGKSTVECNECEFLGEHYGAEVNSSRADLTSCSIKTASSSALFVHSASVVIVKNCDFTARNTRMNKNTVAIEVRGQSKLLCNSCTIEDVEQACMVGDRSEVQISEMKSSGTKRGIVVEGNSTVELDKINIVAVINCLRAQHSRVTVRFGTFRSHDVAMLLTSVNAKVDESSFCSDLTPSCRSITAGDACLVSMTKCEAKIIAISLSKATLRDCSLQQYHSTSLETIFADVQAECVSPEKRSTLKWARSKLDQVIADATSTVEQQRSRMTIYIAVSCVVVVAAFALRQRLGSFQVFGSPTAST